MITATANLGSTITATAELKSVQVGSCLDATVHNSNNSYSTTVASGGDLPLPNIDFTDSTGVTTSVPSMEDIVATPIPPCADATVTVNSTPYGTAPSGGSENVEVVSGVMGTTPRGSLIGGKWFIAYSPFQINGVNRDSLPPETTFDLTVRLNGVEDSGSYNAATDTLDLTSTCPTPSLAVALSDSTPNYGDTITITATPTDITPTQYTFIVQTTFDNTERFTQVGNTFNWTVNRIGTFTIVVEAIDGLGATAIGSTTGTVSEILPDTFTLINDESLFNGVASLANGTAISTVSNQIGGLDYAQSIVARQPLYVTSGINGIAGFRCDAADKHFYKTDAVDVPTEFAITVAYQGNAAGSNPSIGGLWGVAAAYIAASSYISHFLATGRTMNMWNGTLGNAGAFLFPQVLGSAHIVTVVARVSGGLGYFDVWMDGQLKYESITYAIAGSRVGEFIGHGRTTFFGGVIGHYERVNRSITYQEIREKHRVLGSKYNITLTE